MGLAHDGPTTEEAHLLWIYVLLRPVHRPRRLRHHVCHAVHGVVRLNLGHRELGHIGGLVHLGGDGLLGEQHAGLLRRLLRLPLLQKLDAIKVSPMSAPCHLCRRGRLRPTVCICFFNSLSCLAAFWASRRACLALNCHNRPVSMRIS